MAHTETISFNEIVSRYLGETLPEDLTGNAPFDELGDDAKDVVYRLLALMKRGSCPATEINALMIWLLFSVNPAMLPSAWGGRIPPLTAPGRHRKLDAYVAHLPLADTKTRPVFVDLGCGFPPLTTVDTAERLTDWSVYGVDRSFPRYVLYDADGNYACFDRSGGFLYCQSPAKPLTDDPETVRERFTSMFADLRRHMDGETAASRAVTDRNGNRLVCNHVRDFERQHLRFVRSDIKDLRLPPAQVIRCMNVLLYFERSARESMMAAIAECLVTGGLLITGFNHPFGTYARYAVYQKAPDGVLRPIEFAFSLDNLRPLGIGPWLTLSEEDGEAELLADLSRAIRSDRTFWPEFNRTVDTLREDFGICSRGDNGFNYFSEEIIKAPPSVLAKKTAALWDQIHGHGYTEGAIKALRRAGFTAWPNPAGDITVSPSVEALPAIDQIHPQ